MNTLGDPMRKNDFESSSYGDVTSTMEECSSNASSSSNSLGVNLLDIMKESKTSNVNVLVKKNQQNNDLLYDSEKYAKCDKVKLQDSLDNLSRGTGLKRVKEINLIQNCNNVSSYNEEYTNKRLNTDAPMDFDPVSLDEETIHCTEQALTKRMRLEEKNIQHEQHNNSLPCPQATPARVMECVSNIDRATASGDVRDQVSEKRRRRAEKDAQRDLALAEESWRSFVGEGTVLMDAFYGQFKSCLVCSVCGHSSVKFDPFGTLSVPLPHANEMQIVVTYLSSDGHPALKCLLTLCKISYISDLKAALVQLLCNYFRRLYNRQSGEERDSLSPEKDSTEKRSKRKIITQRNLPEAKDIVVAEVFDNHIARMLDDILLTKSINHSTRLIYAFHIPPISPSSPTVKIPMPDIVPLHEHAGKNRPNVNPFGEAFGAKVEADSTNTTTEIRGFLNGGAKIPTTFSARNYTHTGSQIDSEHCEYPSASNEDITMEEISASTSQEVSGGSASSVTESCTSSGSSSSTIPCDSKNDNLVKLESLFDGPNSSGREDAPTSDLSEWKICNICLEEMCQSELKSHGLCYDCLLCENCIDMSCKHHGGDTLPCPVCQVSLTRSSLIPVGKRQTQKPKPRQLRMCVVFRLDAESQDNNKRTSVLVGHPRVIYVPSRLPLSALQAALKQYIPPGADYSLLLVDGRGYNCSRCLFMSHCRGCEINNLKSNSPPANVPKEENIIVNLQAGDTVCVRFTKLSAVQRNHLTLTREHESLALRRQDEPLTLYDCLRAFTRSETLECSESWFCPECQCKQSATKTVSLWKCPTYLIIHLERFLFHGTMSSKVDDKVLFPLENLCMDDYFGGRKIGPHIYNLYGVVSHIGSMAQAGHYTSLVKNPLSGKWRLFNDENCTYRKPCEEEFTSAYLLFYQRNDAEFKISLPDSFPLLHNRSKPASSDVNGTQNCSLIDIADDDDLVEFDKTKSNNNLKSTNNGSNNVMFGPPSPPFGMDNEVQEAHVPVDGWLEASVPTESSSLSRRSPPSLSPIKSPDNNSYKLSPSSSKCSSLPSPLKNNKPEESCSSLELFNVSSPDTSLDNSGGDKPFSCPDKPFSCPEAVKECDVSSSSAVSRTHNKDSSQTHSGPPRN